MVQRTNVLAALMLMEGTAALKLALFERLKAARILDHEDPAEVEATQKTLQAIAAAEDTASSDK